MFCANIAIGNTVWRLLFKTEESLKIAREKIDLARATESEKIIADDFGQEMLLIPKFINGVMFEDLDKAKMAHVELFLHQQRTQALATKAAQSDPGLRASSAMSSPRVLDPMGRLQQ